MVIGEECKGFGSLKYENVELINYKITIPVLTFEDDGNQETKKLKKAKDRFARFYDNINREYKEYFEKELFEKIKREYMLSDDPKKRYRQRPYLVTFSAKGNIYRERYISVVCEFKIIHGRNRVFFNMSSQTWDFYRGIILPYGSVIDKKAVRGENAKRIKGFDKYNYYLDSECAVFYKQKTKNTETIPKTSPVSKYLITERLNFVQGIQK